MDIKHLPNQFFDPVPKEQLKDIPVGSMPLRVQAADKASEIAEMIDDIDSMKELFCVLAYAMGQHEESHIIGYLGTLRRAVENRNAVREQLRHLG